MITLTRTLRLKVLSGREHEPVKSLRVKSLPAMLKNSTEVLVMSDKAKRTTIAISGIEVEGFQLPDGRYAMSQSQPAKAISSDESNVRDFLVSESLKALPDKTYTFGKISIEGNGSSKRGGSQIKIIPIDIAFDFWLDQAFKGNVKAQALVRACGQETLQRRFDNAFGIVKSEQQYERQAMDVRASWEESREYLRSSHTTFTLACSRWKFNPAQAHNLITLAVCGKTAADLRELDVINGSSSIGLNHIENLDAMNRIAKVKTHFSRYRKGDIRERTVRALKDAIKQEKRLLT